MKLRSNLFVIDVETTGPNPFIHDPLSIALVPIDERAESLELFVRTATPQWSSYARENFRSFEVQWEASAREPDLVVRSLQSYLKKWLGKDTAMLVGHNVGFDMAFLRKLAALAGREEIPGLSHRSIDTHTLLFAAHSEGKIPLEALSSDAAFAHFGINFEKGTRHTALHDATATRALFLQLLQLLSKNTSQVASRYSAGHAG